MSRAAAQTANIYQEMGTFATRLQLLGKELEKAGFDVQTAKWQSHISEMERNKFLDTYKEQVQRIKSDALRLHYEAKGKGLEIPMLEAAAKMWTTGGESLSWLQPLATLLRALK